MAKDERGNLLADPQQILNRWRNCFCLLLMYMGQIVSDRFKFTQQSFLCQSLVPLRSGRY
jgi:hypothetical protein